MMPRNFLRSRRMPYLVFSIVQSSWILLVLSSGIFLSFGTDPPHRSVWLGSHSPVWSDPVNWDPAVVPGAPAFILISAGCRYLPVLRASDGQVVIADGGGLLMEPGTTLTLLKGASLELASGASVATGSAARIVLEPGAVYRNMTNGMPQLEVRTVLDGSRGWRMIAAPVITSYEAMFHGRLVTQGFPGSLFPGLPPNLWWWDETRGGTTLQGWSTATGSGEIIPPGRGHFFYLFNGAERLSPGGTPAGKQYSDLLPCTLSVTGTEPLLCAGHFTFQELSFTPRINDPANHQDTDHYVEITSPDAGWNLTGNPTPGTLYWFHDAGWERLNIDKTIYAWDPSAQGGDGAYLVWNGRTGHAALADGAIAPFQAFWIHATGPPLLRFSNLAKRPSPDSFLKDAGAPETVCLPLHLQRGDRESRAFITWSAEGRAGHDPLDAYCLEPPGESRLSVSTAGAEGKAFPLTINNLPLHDPQAFIPLFIDSRGDAAAMAGELVLRWEVPDHWPGNLNLTLIDYRERVAVSMVRQDHYVPDHREISGVAHPYVNPGELPGHPAPKRKSTRQTRSAGNYRFAIIVDDGDPWAEPLFRDSVATLCRVYPNPFTTEITLQFSLPVSSPVKLEVLRADGSVADTPVEQFLNGGLHEICWSVPGTGTGLYFFRLTSNNRVSTRVAVRAKY